MSSPTDPMTSTESKAPLAAVWIVLFASLVDALGFGILLPTLPFFARSLGAGPELVTLTMAVFTGGLFLSMPICGRLSDRFGRKPVISVGLVCVVLAYVALANASTVWFLIAARLVGGLVAGNAAACTAYLVDVTSESERAKYMGISGAIFGFGFIAGPVLGSLLSQGEDGTSFTRPILAAAAMTSVALLAVLLFLPESHRAERARSGVSDATSADPPKLDLVARLQSLSPVLLMVALCHALSGISSGFYETILPLWAADFDLLDGAGEMWILILPGGVGFVFAQAVLIGPLSKRFGEARIVLCAALPLAMLIYGMTLAADAGSLSAAIVVSAILAVFAALVIASNHILASRLADPESRGEVMGLFGSVGTVARTVGMVGSGIVYNQLHPHAPYWFAAVSATAIFAVALRLPRTVLSEVSTVASVDAGNAA